MPDSVGGGRAETRRVLQILARYLPLCVLLGVGVSLSI